MIVPQEPFLPKDETPKILQIPGRDLGRILFICGYTLSDFARVIGRDVSYVSRSLRMQNFIYGRLTQDLDKMLGKENILEAQWRIANGTMRKYLSGREMRAMILSQGYTFRAVGEFIGRSGQFVSDVLGKTERSIPLRYIDALRNLFTPEYYDAELFKMRNIYTET